MLSAQETPADPTCQNTETQICVDKEDLRKFLALAVERQCLDQNTPEFELQPITIITDQEGRVFYTGADPDKPYKLTMRWCHYEVEGDGKVHLVAAMNEPPTWGFRFRPKAYLGYIPTKLLVSGPEFYDGVDAGVMLDLFYWQWANLNLTAGFRSTGAGAGFDLTNNFGLYAGYAFSWSDTPHNVLGGAYFAF